MGCACPTDSKSTVDSLGEETVTLYESALLFSKLPASKTVTAVRIFSRLEPMNTKKLKDLLKDLGAGGALDQERAPVQQLYGMFKFNKKFNSRKIAMLGVLLGAGTFLKKAEVLFSIYLESARTGGLHSSQVHRLIEDACEIALVCLPEFAKSELQALDDTKTAPKLHRYSDKLLKALPTAVTQLSVHFLRHSESVSEAEFKARIAEDDGRVICSASELRGFATRLKLVEGDEKRSRTSVNRVKEMKSVEEEKSTLEEEKRKKRMSKLMRSQSAMLRKVKSGDTSPLSSTSPDCSGISSEVR